MSSDKTQKKQLNLFKTFLIIIYFISILILIYLVVDGFDFYKTSFQERPHHEDYRNLRPAGERGHGLGIIGSAMMLLLLLYSVRKRTKLFNRLGAVNKWLNIHIYFGISGPLLIILHTSFKVNGIVAVSFWSMVAIALSGILGRYIYIQIPHNVIGDELSLIEVQQQKLTINNQIENKFKITEKLVDRLEQMTNGKMYKKRSVLSLLFSMIIDDLTRKRKLKKIVRETTAEFKISSPEIKEIAQLFNTKLLLERKIAFWNKIHQIFHYWHVIHKPFAYVMLLIMFVHIVVAVLMGYTWF